MLTTHSIGITIQGVSLKKQNNLKKLYFSTIIAWIHLVHQSISISLIKPTLHPSTTLTTSFDCNFTNLIKSPLSDEKAGVLKTNERIDLYDALKSLSQKEHDVIKQRYFEGLSQSEIAKELFISQAQYH